MSARVTDSDGEANRRIDRSGFKGYVMLLGKGRGVCVCTPALPQDSLSEKEECIKESSKVLAALQA